MGSNKNQKIKALNDVIEHLKYALVKTIENGVDRDANGDNEIPIFEMLKSGVDMMELSYKVKAGLLTEEQAKNTVIDRLAEKHGQQHRDTIAEAFDGFDKEAKSSNDTIKFEDLPEDKKKLVN
jgi:hypothetical protein